MVLAVSALPTGRWVGIDVPEEARGRLAQEPVTASLELRDLRRPRTVAHPSVRGIGVARPHAFFDGRIDHLDARVDLAAGRAVALGGYARGTSHGVAVATPLAPYPGDARPGAGRVRAPAERLRVVAQRLRRRAEAAANADPDRVDVLAPVPRDLEKDLWVVAAHLDR